MLEKMIRDDLRAGKTYAALDHASEVERLVKLQVLERRDSLMLQLLAARLLEICCEAINDEYARKVDLFVGNIFASDQLPKGEVRDESERFRVRMLLNRGNQEQARFFVNRIDRRIAVITSGFGQRPIEKADDNEEKITPPTWLLLAEVALLEGNFEEAERALQNARTKWGQSQVNADDHVLYEMLWALAKVGLNDQAGVAALAHLYSSHMLSDSSLDVAMKSRIAAAAGFVESIEGISKLECARWRSLGPAEHESVEAYLGCGDLPEGAAEIFRGLTDETEIENLIDGIGKNEGVSNEHLKSVAEAGNNSSDFPSDFSLEHRRLDSITGLFDLDKTTGPLVIDWSRCDDELIADAVAHFAISELALRVKSATIFFNAGAYVDAVFHTDDEEIRGMSPGDVIFEIYRIAMARLPKSRARQIADGPEAEHTPERMNVRPNDFNLDVVRRFDETNAALLGGGKEVQEEEEDPFANWTGFGPAQQNAEEIETHIGSPELTASVLEPFEGIFSADSLQKICDAVIAALKELGDNSARVEIMVEDASEPVGSAGVESFEGLVWSSLDAGPLKLRLGVVNVSSEYQHIVRLIMDAAVHRLRVMPGTHYRGRVIEVPGFIASDSVTQKMLETVRVFASIEKNFLITGERGVGKEHVARLLHQWSPRKDKPFVPVDGGVLNNPDQLAAELFGAAKGSYTGAVGERRGVVQEADGGDLFIDEIDEGVSVQSVLKRFAQFGTYKSVGRSKEAAADVRLIIATNQIGDGEAMIKEDLKDRFWEIRVPALRERRGDIRPLAEHFALQFSMVLPETVLAWLETLEWPGNIRQLQNVVERACSLAQNPSRLTLDFFEECVERTGGKKIALMSSDDPSFVPLRRGETLNERLIEHEKIYILAAIKAVGGNKTKAADLLGMKRPSLHARIRSLFGEADVI
jgi:two-component system, NtrC family, response regulator HydG